MADVTSPFGFPYPEDDDFVRDGAQDIENLATGVNDYLAGGYLFAGRRIYTSSGTFLKADPLGTGDIGLRAIRVISIGGGGGGGGCATTGASQAAVAGSGSGGGAGISFITNIAGLTTSVDIVRGGGGAGGSAGQNDGTGGAASTFGSGEAFEVRGGGGRAGAGGEALAPPAVRGTLPGSFDSIGDRVIGGTRLGPRNWIAFDFAAAMPGGYSPLAGQSRGWSQTGTGVNGEAGQRVGEGGGGAINTQNQSTARSGGAGANGIVIIDCFV